MSYFNNPNLPMRDYSFDGKNAQHANVERPTAMALREAWEDLMLAQQELDEAQKKVPSYTAQWVNADYTRNQEQTFIVASNAFEDALVASVRAKS